MVQRSKPVPPDLLSGNVVWYRVKSKVIALGSQFEGSLADVNCGENPTLQGTVSR